MTLEMIKLDTQNREVAKPMIMETEGTVPPRNGPVVELPQALKCGSTLLRNCGSKKANKCLPTHVKDSVKTRLKKIIGHMVAKDMTKSATMAIINVALEAEKDPNSGSGISGPALLASF